VFVFSLPFHALPRYAAGMRAPIRKCQTLVKCKSCGAQTPNLTKGVPVLPTPVPCKVCGTKRVYRPSEVFIGTALSAIAGVRRSSLARHHHASVSSPVED
jgi:hypothetical protein